MLDLFRAQSPAHLVRVLDLALHSGLARADLCLVGRQHDRGHSLQGRRKKTAKPFRVTVTDDLRAFLSALPTGDAVTYLTNLKGLPWTPDGLSASFDGHRRELGIDFTLHDLRANRACQLYRVGFGDEDVADELGWSPKTARHIRQHYVDEESMIARRVRRLSENDHRTKSV